MALLTFMCEGLRVKNGKKDVENVLVRVPTFADAETACEQLARNRNWSLYSHQFVYLENRSEYALLGVC